MAKFFEVKYGGQDMRIATHFVAYLRDANPKKPGDKTHLMLGDGSNGTAIEIKEPVNALIGRIRAADSALGLLQYTDDRGNPGFVNPAYVYTVEEGPKNTAVMRIFGVNLSFNRLPTSHTIDDITRRLESG
jgi:hypothetical protein